MIISNLGFLVANVGKDLNKKQCINVWGGLVLISRVTKYIYL